MSHIKDFVDESIAQLGLAAELRELALDVARQLGDEIAKRFATSDGFLGLRGS